MLKRSFLLMLSVFAIVPFAGQVSAATQEIKANDDTVAWFFWGGRGYGYGYGGYRGYGYGNYGYGGYGYGGCGCGCYSSCYSDCGYGCGSDCGCCY